MNHLIKNKERENTFTRAVITVLISEQLKNLVESVQKKNYFNYNKKSSQTEQSTHEVRFRIIRHNTRTNEQDITRTKL